MIYIAKFEEGVYVLHAFEGETRRPDKGDIDLARSRLGAVLSLGSAAPAQCLNH
jgi:phage-related protein